LACDGFFLYFLPLQLHIHNVKLLVICGKYMNLPVTRPPTDDHLPYLVLATKIGMAVQTGQTGLGDIAKMQI
jgi:hypothetical protein